jgi:hypothetical protein
MRRRLKENQSHRSDSYSQSRQAHTPDNRHNNIITHIHTHTDTDVHTRTHTDSTYTPTSGIKRIKSPRSLLEQNSTTHSQSPSTPTTAPSSNSRISSGSLSVLDSRISASSVFEFNSTHFAAEERSHGLYDVLMERLMKR